ncbi:L-serine ammonia-lyase [Sphingorhabdus soli]|uniref:L-serine dehydratase n=1 Tax=Flavisphingopyxis soli TaxID=2601267 RepID=A0A5C6UMM2_9SPHN|nr:L-serine ammonia-lyase [Sphingorhabdus soli]TXC73780.1 L-serine ammonia-lyase [Sphingorhabdus soli]
MAISVFELFKIGVGPSSSHTTGPMVAAGRFGAWLAENGFSDRVAHLVVDFYGSLALTGKGHASDTAVAAGLAGERPDTTSGEAIAGHWARANAEGLLPLMGGRDVAFHPARDIRFNTRQKQKYHSNAMAFEAFDHDGSSLVRRAYYSIGGGFVVNEDEIDDATSGAATDVPVPYDFCSGEKLLAIGEREGLSFAEIVMANERARDPDGDIEARLDHVAAAMAASIDRGCCSGGILPGGLNVKRRAPQIADDLDEKRLRRANDPMAAMDWINLWAMAVNEENAAGGQVVTAPTNGAAGIIPAVIRLYEKFYDGDKAGVRTFLLTAGAIGALYKRNASISGAEVGCQGEVGVACSMAAAGLAAALGASNAQIENAAEIGMEHNLGLTCDPIGGLVQIPCIERNAMGAVKAIDAARIAMIGDGTHMVSLDKVIATMFATGRDMRSKYKETSKGGLAVSVVEC